MEQKRPPAIVLIVGIAAIAGLNAFALHNGVDGALFMSTIGVIGLIVGVKLPDFWNRRN